MEKYHYKAFGFQISSEIPIKKFLQCDNKETDIFIQHLTEKPQLNNILLSKGNFIISNNSFLFNTGDNYFYYKHDEKSLFVNKTNESRFEQYLCGPIFSLICAFNNNIPLHASELHINNVSVLICGNSGSGKSTLLYHLIHKYNAVFSADDIVPLKSDSDKIKSLPAFPEIKLWLDAVERFNAKIVEPVHPELKKYYVNVFDYFRYQELSPKIILVIQPTLKETISIDKIMGLQKFLLLTKYIYRKNIIETMFKQLTFKTVSALANQTMIYLIKRPYHLDTSEWESNINKIINDECLN